MSSQAIFGEIIGKIKKLYDNYEEKANKMAEDKGKKTGNKADRFEDQFLKRLAELQALINQTLQQMKKIQRQASNQFVQNMRIVEDCLKDIRFLLKKKPLNFKISIQINKIIDDTKISLEGVRKDLKNVKQTKFLCCGVDGQKKFKTPMNLFKIMSGKWKMLTLFQPKDGIQTFVSPSFNERQFQFIAQILKKNWPQPQQKIVERQIVKQVIKQVKVSSGGQPPSALNKANQYLFGINKEQNIVQGLQVYHTQAEKGNVQACTFLGKIYEQGLLLPIDLKKAQNYYKISMKEKDPYGQYRYALSLIKGKFNKEGPNQKDIKLAHQILQKIADESQNQCAQALAQLGQLYEYGNFLSDINKLYIVKKDLNKAIEYLRKAKKLKLARASNNLGVLYLNLKLNEKSSSKQSQSIKIEDDKQVIAFIVQAKQQGFLQAYYNLGMIYSKGLLGPRDADKALQNFYQGGIKGDYKCRIKFAYQLMNQTSVHKQQYEDHYHLAVQWLDSVVRKLDLNYLSLPKEQILKEERGQALFYLGIFYQNGFGVEKSPKKAVSYFLQSSNLDYAAAKNKIGDCYFSGYGLQLNRQLAIGCYLEAAEQGSSDAMVNLGSVYLNGLPGLIQRSYKKAYQYFLNAHELQNTNAMIHLSYMYKNGLGVEANMEVTKDLLEQAAQLKDAKALYMLKEMGIQFNQAILFEQLQNQFFAPPKKINLKEIVPVLKSVAKNK